MHRLLFATAFLSMAFAVSARPLVDNARLSAIFNQDQQVGKTMPIDWTIVGPQDRAHRVETLQLLKAGKVRTSNDYYHAAMVLQHGEALEDFRLAFSLAQISATLDPANKQARWLSAASWDRILKSKNVAQWYGTQYFQPTPGAPMALYKVDDSAVSDAERTEMNVPTLQAAKDLLLEINR